VATALASADQQKLPVGWRWRSLRSLTAEYFSGRRPKGGVAGVTEGLLSLGGEHLAWDGTLNLTTPRRIPEAFAETMAESELAPDDILIVKDGATTGKTAFVKSLTERAFVNEHVFVVRPTEEILPKYLFYWLWSRAGFQQIMLDFRGAAQGGIGRTFVDKVSVPWVALSVQHGIVARIDELFSELDDAEEELRRARAELETYRKSLLKAAVTGELTADWRAANPPNESAADLLARILTDRRARWEVNPGNKGKRYKELENAEGNLPFELPEHWACAAVGQLGDVVTGATPSTSRPDFYGGDVPFFTPGDLEGDVVRTTKRTLTEAGRDSVRAIPRGSVLVTCIGATIGKLAVADASGVTNQQINSVIPAEPILSNWLYAFLSSPWGQHEITDRSSSTTLPILNKGDFLRVPLPLPPRQEIQQLCASLSARLIERRALEEELRVLWNGPATLRQSILAAAFRGELVQ
jgi:type I restriction enzyme, S subunit